MNIDISDEMIEKIVEKQVAEKVKDWFSKNTLKDVVYKVVTHELYGKDSCDFYDSTIREEAKKLMSKEVLDGVCRRISADIADAVAEKFNY